MPGNIEWGGSNEEQKLTFTVADRDMLRECYGLLKKMESDNRVSALEIEVREIKLRMAKWAGGLIVIFTLIQAGPWLLSHFKI